MRARGDVHDKLGAVLIALVAGGSVEMTSSWQRGWASATFIGARHRYRLQVYAAPEAELEAFAQTLGKHEFSLPGHLVADICVRELTRREGNDATLEIEALTVDVF